jgi:quercetin dioxygenase-like cupin family protein
VSESAIRRLARDERQRYLWGDDESRHVIDWYYLASPELLVSIHVLPPGGRYGHSETHKSFYAADECYYLLRGELTFHNPETGEVHTVRAGETLHFRAGTWHHGYNFGTETCEILVAFAPLPPDITAAADISKLATPLSEIRGGRYELLADFPWNRVAAPRDGDRILKLRADEWLELIHGENQPVRVQLFVATDKLTMGRITLPSGVVTDAAQHPGDLVGLVTDGWAGVFEDGRSDWVELRKEDGVVIPGGVRYRLMNTTDRPTEFVFGAARYR